VTLELRESPEVRENAVWARGSEGRRDGAVLVNDLEV